MTCELTNGISSSDDDDEVQAVLPDGGYDYNSYGADVPDYGEGEIQRGMDEIQLVRVLPKVRKTLVKSFQ